MYILAIETTGPYCSVALLSENGDLYEKTGTQVMNHLQTLTPMINEIMEERKVSWEEIKHIAVSVGPGSFTGIRIGVSAGRALNQITGIPLIAVPTLDAFGRQGEEDGEYIVCPILDARRSQIYGGAYRGAKDIIPGGPYMLDDFLDILEKEDNILFVGDGLKAYGERISVWAEEKGKTIRCEDINQSAGRVAKEAAGMENPSELDYDTLKPNYMRIPEAERKLQEKKETL